MSWVLDIFLKEFVLAIVFAVICYLIWRLANPGRAW